MVPSHSDTIQPLLISMSPREVLGKAQSSLMTFGIIATFGNVQELFITVDFWPCIRTDICVHTIMSNDYANTFLKL